jgi:hypothetical protein
MLVKFECIIDDKQKYYEVKEKVNFAKGTFLRENVKDLKDEFNAKLEIMVHGRFLYMDLKNSGLCKSLSLELEV